MRSKFVHDACSSWRMLQPPDKMVLVFSEIPDSHNGLLCSKHGLHCKLHRTVIVLLRKQFHLTIKDDWAICHTSILSLALYGFCTTQIKEAQCALEYIQL